MSIILKLIFSLALFSYTAEKKTDLSKVILKDMTLTYSKVEYMKSQYEKEQTSELLGEMDNSKGTVEFSRGRIRVEEKKNNERNIFIKNKTKFWHLQPDNQVVTGPVSKAVPSIFEMMFSDPSVWDELESKTLKSKGDLVTIKIIMGKDKPNYSNFTLTINTKKRRFEDISFEDEVGNKTDIKFKKTSFFRKAKEERFVYQPKKTDRLNSL
jgi:hypothetical protein